MKHTCAREERALPHRPSARGGRHPPPLLQPHVAQRGQNHSAGVAKPTHPASPLSRPRPDLGPRGRRGVLHTHGGAHVVDGVTAAGGEEHLGVLQRGQPGLEQIEGRLLCAGSQVARQPLQREHDAVAAAPLQLQHLREAGQRQRRAAIRNPRAALRRPQQQHNGGTARKAAGGAGRGGLGVTQRLTRRWLAWAALSEGKLS